MKINVVEAKDAVIVEGVRDFELAHIFECGQCFRWNKEDDESYTGVAKGRLLNIRKEGDKLIFNHTNKADFYNIWVEYFDLNRDYGKIKNTLAKKDEVMRKAIKYGEGIRILNQDEWETLISFIISSNKGINMIKQSIELLCQKYGTFIKTYRGKKYYDFPSPQALLNKSIEEIKEETRVGYRAKYIADTVYAITEKKVDLYHLKNLSTEEAKQHLMCLAGVGPKVADCILLFSMKKYDAFPIDVWVKRIMTYFYFPKGASQKNIQYFAKKKFGMLGGFAQQYLFYYARELNIGKNL